MLKQIEYMETSFNRACNYSSLCCIPVSLQLLGVYSQCCAHAQTVPGNDLQARARANSFLCGYDFFFIAWVPSQCARQAGGYYHYSYSITLYALYRVAKQALSKFMTSTSGSWPVMGLDSSMISMQK